MLHKVLKTTFVALVGGCLLGCVAVQVVWEEKGTPYSPRRSAEDIHVFVEEPDTNFIKIAGLQARTGMATQKAIDKLKKKASELGGDGIVLKSVYSEETTHPPSEYSDAYKTEVRYLQVLVIRYSP